MIENDFDAPRGWSAFKYRELRRGRRAESGVNCTHGAAQKKKLAITPIVIEALGRRMFERVCGFSRSTAVIFGLLTSHEAVSLQKSPVTVL